MKREKGESEPAGVCGSVKVRFRQAFCRGGWRIVISESEDSPYHPEDEGFGVGSVLRTLGPPSLVGSNHLVVVSVAL